MANQFDLGRFDDCPTKEWLQGQVYTHLSLRMKSNVMVVGGPSIKRQINNAFKIASTPKAKVYLIENNTERYNEMECRLRYMIDGHPMDPWPQNHQWLKDWYSKVQRVYGDVASYEMAAGLNRPVRFEDLDMCETMSSIQHLVRYRLALQSEISGSSAGLRKCMLITSSLRGCELDTTLDALFKIIQDILGAKVVLWKGTKGAKHSRLYKEHGVKEYSPYMENYGRILNNGLRYYTYRDGAPMFSCTIFYI